MVVAVLWISLERAVTCRVAAKNCAQKSDVVSRIEL
jgi:hypothetical protein